MWMLLLLLCSACHSTVLRALLSTTESQYTDTLYGTLDTVSGSFGLVQNWTLLGACTGGHAFASSPQGDMAITTLFLDSELNWVYLFGSDGIAKVKRLCVFLNGWSFDTGFQKFSLETSSDSA